MRLHHHLSMILFPSVLLGISLLSTALSTPQGHMSTFVGGLIIFIMGICLYEPLEHGFSLWVSLSLIFLASLYIPFFGILLLVFLPIWRIIKYFRDFCFISDNVLSFQSGVVLLTKKKMERDNLALVSCKQGFFGSILHYGDLTFYSRDGHSFTYRYVRNPKSHRDSLQLWIEGGSL